MEDTDELLARLELKRMTPEERDKVPYDKVKWFCKVKGCTNGTTVRDYGLSPEFFHPGKGKGWINITFFYWLCGKHNKWFKRLKRSFHISAIERRLLDHEKQIIK